MYLNLVRSVKKNGLANSILRYIKEYELTNSILCARTDIYHYTTKKTNYYHNSLGGIANLSVCANVLIKYLCETIIIHTHSSIFRRVCRKCPKGL